MPCQTRASISAVCWLQLLLHPSRIRNCKLCGGGGKNFMRETEAFCVYFDKAVLDLFYVVFGMLV